MNHGTTITHANYEDAFGDDFGLYRKAVLTKASNFTVPPGTTFDTPEGLKAEDEECRIAVDSQGGVYPIRESVFQNTYEKAGE
jgi:hypothetical protein